MRLVLVSALAAVLPVGAAAAPAAGVHGTVWVATGDMSGMPGMGG